MTGPAPEATPATTTAAASGPAEERAIEAAWLGSMNAFYIAGERGDPGYPPLYATLVPDSPESRQEGGFLSLQMTSGAIGPSTWRIGNAVVVSLSGASATVEGCAYDPGAHYRSTGAPAPADLGGGAGLTASVTTMQEVDKRWLVYSTTVTFPQSVNEAGPCEGF